MTVQVGDWVRYQCVNPHETAASTVVKYRKGGGFWLANGDWILRGCILEVRPLVKEAQR